MEGAGEEEAGADAFWGGGVMTDNKMIRVWPFYDAPPELQALSEHGGDEDWLALVPSSLAEAWLPWLEGWQFGNDVTTHTLPDGSRVFIAAHA